MKKLKLRLSAILFACLTISSFSVSAQAPITNMSGTVCAGDNAQFRVTTSCSISQWVVSPGGVIQGSSTDPVVYVKWNSPEANAWVQVSYTNCSPPSFLGFSVVAKSNPTVSLSMPATVCQPQTVTLQANTTNVSGTPNYTWYIDNQSVATTSTPSYNYTASSLSAGTHSAKVTISAMSCSNLTTVTSTLQNFTITGNVGQVSQPSSTTSRCQGGGTNNFTANATNATSYSWSITPSAGSITSGGVVTWNAAFSGTATVTVIANGCNGSSTTASTNVTVIAPVGQVGVPVGTTSRCNGSGSDIYSATAPNGQSYTWTLSPASAGSISPNGGSVVWNSTFSGVATITVEAHGCTGPTTSNSVQVNVIPNVGAVSTPSGSTTRCIGGGTSTFTAAATNASSYSWSITPAAGSISLGGVVTWNSTFSGTAVITVVANGCNGSISTAATNVTVMTVVGQVSQPSGVTLRCPGAGTNTYTASAANALSYSWSISPTTAGSISSGTVTWSGTFSGTATVTVVANGCNGSTSTAFTTVTVPYVGAVTLSGISSRCQGGGTDAFSGDAANATGYTYSLLPAEAGTIVSGAAGYVTWDANFLGTATISVTATGCNGVTATATKNVLVTPKAGQVKIPLGDLTRCQGVGQTSYFSNAINTSGYSWTISPSTAGSINNAGTEAGQSKAVVTWNSSFSGTASITVTALGCTPTTASVSVTVSSMPTVDLNPIGVISTIPLTLSTPAVAGNTYQWYLNGSPVSGKNENSWTVSQRGNYTVQVSSGNCSIISPIPATVTSGVYHVFADPNYIKERTAKVDKRQDGQPLTESDMGTLQIGDRQETINYFDGLGRLMQTVTTKGSPSGTDLVQPVIYDNYRREATSYLPYTAGNDGSFKATFSPKEFVSYPSSAQYLFYQSGGNLAKDTRPYGETFYEESPLNRPVKRYGPGQSWSAAGDNKFVRYEYLLNTHSTLSSPTDEKVIAWKIGINGMPGRMDPVAGYIEAGGYYNSRSLTVNVATDEEGGVVREYINKIDQIVLKKVKVISTSTNLNNTNEWALTYYIYDDLGNLSYVFQPELSKKLHSGIDTYAITSDDLNNFAFQYRYDLRNRVIEKQVPSAGAVHMVYDNRDRLVMTQNAKQRSSPKEWTFTKYDALNRPVLTGKYLSDNDRGQMQIEVDKYYNGDALTGEPVPAQRSWFESYVGASGARLGYDNKSFPTVPVEGSYLIAIYYDLHDSYIAPSGYAYSPESINDPETLIPHTTSISDVKAKGLVTATLVRNLFTNQLMRTVNYYDAKYRIVQTIGDHQKGTTKISTIYDFIGKVLLTKRIYTVNGVSTTVVENPDYDHMDRLKWVKHSLNGAPGVVLTKNDYNELGQLVDKKLHSTNTTGAGAKQSVDYRYNIRGWLTRINDSNLTLEDGDAADFFGMNLAYDADFETGNFSITKKRYDGNISAMRWSNELGQGNVKEAAYNFTYDAMDRLLTATHKQSTAVNTWMNGQYDENVSYDLNGNILTLQRKGQGAVTIDNLVYNYGTGSSLSNKLLYVKDITTNATDKVKGFNDVNAGDVQDYTYDANGNLTRDLNKGIGNTISDTTNIITYNFLNLPETVNKGGNNIRYIYDATGKKLSQITNFGTTSKQVDYIGELQFENDVLQFINHPEGRIVMAENELIALHDGDTEDGLESANGALLSVVTQNGDEKYVQAQANGTAVRQGMVPIGGAFNVEPGEKYLVRAKGYTTGSSPAYLRLVGDVDTNIQWPGAKLPTGLASESWIEQTVTIPAGITIFQAGLAWNTVTSGEIMFLNQFEIIKLTTSSAPEYQYHLKDHLGNVRVTFTTKSETDEGVATLEIPNQQEEASQFIYYDEAVKINAKIFDHTYDAQAPPSSVQVTGIKLFPTSATIAVGETTRLTETVLPLDASNLDVDWFTSNSNIATVNDGLVTAISPGTATITAMTEDGRYTKPATVTVSGSGGVVIQNGEMDSGSSNWSLADFTTPSGASLSVVQGAGMSGPNALKVDVVNTDDSGWMLQLEQVLGFRLEVGKSYRVSFMAKAQSPRPITVALFGNGNLYNYYFSYDPFNLTTTPQTYSFEYTCTDGNVNSEPDFSLKFYLASGVISDVWLDGIKIEDITGRVTAVSVDPTVLVLNQGQTWMLSKTVTPSNANNQQVAWSSDNENVATVDRTSGLVTAVASGSATITATAWDGGLTAATSVTVPAFASTPIQNGEFDSGTSGWSLVDYTTPSGASISTVTGAGLSGSNALRVDVVNTNDSGWMLQLEQLLGFRLEVGKTYRFSFMAKAESARTMDASLFGNGSNYNYFFSYGGIELTTSPQTYTFDFTCNDTNVNTEPNFSAKFYLANGVVSDVWIDKVSIQDITPVISVTGIDLSHTTLNLNVGQKGQITKTISPSNASNQNVNWSSDDPAIATVSNTGLVTAIANGSTTVRATTQSGSFVDQATVNVTTPPTSYSMRLTGAENHQYGLAKSFSVMPGDVISMEVYAKYVDTNKSNWNAAITNLISAIANGTAPAGVHVDGTPGSIDGATFPFVGLMSRTNDTGTGPKAYLNYLLFDRNMVFKTGGFKRLSSTPKEDGTDVPHEKLAFEGAEQIVIKEPGYMYIYLSNENETPVEVYFDDFKVSHQKGPLVSMQDYYPFGLSFNSYTRENSIGQSYLYNGKEIQDELNLGWLDYVARQYDPAIGRFTSIDPAADLMRRHSPYNYAYDNPIIFTDPDGMVPEEQGKFPFGGINFNAGMTEEELQQKREKSADMQEEMEERSESERFLRSVFSNRSSGSGKSRSERRQERQERRAAKKKGNRENLVEFLQFFFNEDLIRLNKMADKNNWVIRWKIEEKDKYTRWFAPGDTREESGTADGKRKVLVSLHRTVFTDPRVLYTVISHEFVHLEDHLNGNIDLWEGWYSEQQAVDIAEHHAYMKSNPIAEQMGITPRSLPQLPDTFLELKFWNDW